MANNSRLPFPRISSPEPAGSDANSSVQVQLDAHSHRGPSSRPSPLRAFEQQHTGRPVATLSQSSNAVYLSPESSSQNATAGPPAAAEDILVDLITTPTEPSGGAQHFNTALEKLVSAGQKRPREGDDDDKDDEFLGEPLAKRDKLGEELEQLGQIIASSSSHSGIDLPPSPIQLSGSLLSVTSVTAHGESGHGLKGDMQAISDGSNTLFIGTRQTVPIRAATRRLPIRHLEAKRDPNPPAEAEDGDGHDEKSEAEDASNSDEDEARRGRR